MAGQGMHQSQNFSLQQALAPQMQQSLHILQASILELSNMVREELEINPVLEESEPVTENPEEVQESDDFEKEFEQLAKMDEEWRDYMAQTHQSMSRSSDDEERRQHFFDSLVEHTTLQQHLVEQLRLNNLSSDDLKLAELIIGNIDENGFLQSSPEEMSLNTGIEKADFERLVSLLQTFDPPGVAAADLRESLLIQLRLLGRADSLEYQMIDGFMDDLGRRRFPEIARKLGLPVGRVQEAADRIARLEPKPGHAFAATPNQYVLADITVERVGDEFVANLNNEQIPHLRISNTYKDLMSGGASGAEVKDYIREKIRSGKFLIKSIHQRQQTIQNIANQILLRQRDFFEGGPALLKPLTMVQVAEMVGVHETTVSRAISGKYMETPHGIFEMKYFFTPGYETSSGVQMSNTSVKEAIQDLVKTESGSNPLSDKEIVDILEERGIPIARRTVAKYRTELNILPSNMRKVY